MGHTIVKNISINLNNLTFSGSFASNNVRPITYEKFTSKPFVRPDYVNSVLSDKDVFILSLINDVAGGMLKLNHSVSAKYRYAFQKTFNDFRTASINGITLDFDWRKESHSIDDFFDFYTSVVHNGDKSPLKVEALVALVQQFTHNLNESFNKINGRITIDQDKFVLNINQMGSFNYSHLEFYDGCEKYFYTDFKSLYCDLAFLQNVRPNYKFNFSPANYTYRKIEDELAKLKCSTTPWDAFMGMNDSDMIEFINGCYLKLLADNHLDYDIWYSNNLPSNAFKLGFPNGKTPNDSTIDPIDLVGKLKPISLILNQTIKECMLAKQLGFNSIQNLNGLYDVKTANYLVDCNEVDIPAHHVQMEV